MKNKTTVELIEKLQFYKDNGIRCFAAAHGFLHVKAVLKTRGISIDDDVFFSRPKKDASPMEIKSFKEFFNTFYLLWEN